MTPIAQILRQTVGDEALEIVGQPLRSKAEIIVAVDRLNDEVGRVGRLLIKKYGFDYPTALEAMVIGHWSDFKKGNGEHL